MTTVISGGTFNNTIFGGNLSVKSATSQEVNIYGDVNLTFDVTESDITATTEGKNIVAGCSGKGSISKDGEGKGGNVTVTIKGDGTGTHAFNFTGILVGGSEATYFTTAADGTRTCYAYVDGARTLNFDGYVGEFAGTIRAFDTLNVVNGTSVSFTNSRLGLTDVETWNIQAGCSLFGIVSTGFQGDTLNIDLTGWNGDEWTVLATSSAKYGLVSFADFASVNLGDESAQFVNGAWETDNLRLAIASDNKSIVLAAKA